jgi:hypothetical protein
MKRGRHGRGRGSKKAPVHLVISYVPLLRGKAGATIPLAHARETLGPMLETDAGHVEAVVWACDDDGSPWPILVLDRADEIFEHLVEWAEGSPAAWFKLAWTTRRDSYALALMPRVDKSVERYKLARRILSSEEVPPNASFQDRIPTACLSWTDVSGQSRDARSPACPGESRVPSPRRATRRPRRPRFLERAVLRPGRRGKGPNRISPAPPLMHAGDDRLEGHPYHLYYNTILYSPGVPTGGSSRVPARGNAFFRRKRMRGFSQVIPGQGYYDRSTR